MQSLSSNLATRTLLAGGLMSLTLGCGALMSVAGFPPEARRTTKPVGIDSRAVQIGAQTARTSLLAADGSNVTFGGPAAKETLLVFYRGHW
ncbi:MAG: hypothetical protein KC502_11695 [Myxococcales bacterium]|nr:hypothetical protein [Myxococcales bacterium]